MKITAIKSIDYLANRILNVGDTISNNKAVHTAQNKSNRKTGRKKPIK